MTTIHRTATRSMSARERAKPQIPLEKEKSVSELRKILQRQSTFEYVGRDNRNFKVDLETLIAAESPDSDTAMLKEAAKAKLENDTGARMAKTESPPGGNIDPKEVLNDPIIYQNCPVKDEKDADELHTNPDKNLKNPNNDTDYDLMQEQLRCRTDDTEKSMDESRLPMDEAKDQEDQDHKQDWNDPARFPDISLKDQVDLEHDCDDPEKNWNDQDQYLDDLVKFRGHQEKNSNDLEDAHKHLEEIQDDPEKAVCFIEPNWNPQEAHSAVSEKDEDVKSDPEKIVKEKKKIGVIQKTKNKMKKKFLCGKSEKKK